MTVVLDSSATLAWLFDEAGADRVAPLLRDALMSSVNWSEVLQKAKQHGGDPAETSVLLRSLGVAIVDATEGDARLAANFWEPRSPLSLADRFCIALGWKLGLAIATAEHRWVALGTGAEIIVVR